MMQQSSTHLSSSSASTTSTAPDIKTESFHNIIKSIRAGRATDSNYMLLVDALSSNFFNQSEDQDIFWNLLHVLFQYPELARTVLAITYGGYKGTILHSILANEYVDQAVKLFELAQQSHVKINYAVQDKEGKSILFTAINVFADKVVNLIISDMRSRQQQDINENLKSLVNLADKDGRSPIALASFLGQFKVVIALKINGAEIAYSLFAELQNLTATQYKQKIIRYLQKIEIHPDRDLNVHYSIFGLTDHSFLPLPKDLLARNDILTEVITIPPHAAWASKVPETQCCLVRCSKNIFLLVLALITDFDRFISKKLCNVKEQERCQLYSRFKSDIFDKNPEELLRNEKWRKLIIDCIEAIIDFSRRAYDSRTADYFTEHQKIILYILSQIPKFAHQSILDSCINNRKQVLKFLAPSTGPSFVAISEAKIKTYTPQEAEQRKLAILEMLVQGNIADINIICIVFEMNNLLESSVSASAMPTINQLSSYYSSASSSAIDNQSSYQRIFSRRYAEIQTNRIFSSPENVDKAAKAIAKQEFKKLSLG